MAGCGNDKKKAFLNNTKARNKHRIEEAQKIQDRSSSRNNGRTDFIARVIGLPREESAVTIRAQGVEYAAIVKIRIQDLDYHLPDPAQTGLDERSTVVAIHCHREAYVPTSMTDIKSGDLITINFSTAPMVNGVVNNNMKPPIVTGIIKSDQTYYNKVIKNLGSKRKSLFQSLAYEGAGAGQYTEDDFSPRKLTHWTGAQLFNSQFEKWPDDAIEYLETAAATMGDIIEYDNGFLYYTPPEDGNFLQFSKYKNNQKGKHSTYDSLKNDSLYTDEESYSSGTQYAILRWNPTVTDMFFITAIDVSLAQEFIDWCIFHWKNWGTAIVVNELERTFDKQLQYYNNYKADPQNNAIAAPPGRSNHGWAMAVDMVVEVNRITGRSTSKGRGRLSYTDAHSKWIHANIKNYSFNNDEGRNLKTPEAWHMSPSNATRKKIFK